MGKRQYLYAIDNLLEGNKIYNSDTRLFNYLGFCHYKNRQKDKALPVFKTSFKK